MKPTLLLLAVAGLALGQASQPAAVDCAIDGVVVNSVTGEPIPRARVGLQIASGSLRVGGDDSSTSADSSGKWSLSNVACGPARLNVTRPGFIPKPGPPSSLLSGSPVHDLKIEMTQQSVFVGRVLDDQGDPVVGADISALVSRVVDGHISFQRAGAGNTNDLGEYRIAGLQRGKYIVCATAPGVLTVAESCYPGLVEGGSASAMEIPAGRETRVDFALSRAQGIHVRGTVSGFPAGRGGLSLVKRGANAGPGRSAGNVNNSNFDFRVAPGSYTLMADYYEAGKHLLARIPIEAGTSDVDNIAVALEGSLNVAGTVAIASQSGRTIPGLQPEPSINLRQSEPINSGVKRAKWDADRNAFTFDDMAPGSYRLDASPPSPFYVKSAALAGQDILTGEFPLSQGSGPIEIVLSDDGGSIEGDVVDADGQPAMGGIMALRNGRAVVAQTTGHFKLQNLAPGDYTVYAWDDPAEVAYADTDWMRRYGGNGIAVTVTASQSSQVKLTQQKVPE